MVPGNRVASARWVFSAVELSFLAQVVDDAVHPGLCEFLPFLNIDRSDPMMAESIRQMILDGQLELLETDGEFQLNPEIFAVASTLARPGRTISMSLLDGLTAAVIWLVERDGLVVLVQPLAPALFVVRATESTAVDLVCASMHEFLAVPQQRMVTVVDRSTVGPADLRTASIRWEPQANLVLHTASGTTSTNHRLAAASEADPLLKTFFA